MEHEMNSTNEPQDVPLSVLFQRARTIAESSEASTSQEKSQDAIRDLEACISLTGRLGLFSRNEEVDDISTGNLKYLLIHAYLASLLARTHCVEPGPRAAILGQAMEHYSRFVSICSDYGLVSKELAAVAASADPGADPLDPAVKRASKIARFKREREVKAALESLQEKRFGRLRLAQLDDDGEGEDGVAGVAEEDERDLWLLVIESQLLQAVEQMAFLKTELELLQHAASLPAAERHRAPELGAGPPAEVMHVLAQAAANLERNTASGTAASRAQVRRDVLRPSHNLPTITLRQQAEYEIEQAKKTADSSAAAAAKAASKLDKDDEGDDDAAIKKARDWDEFKDDNPRGWGNRKGQG